MSVLSIIIPAYNVEEYIQDTLEAIVKSKVKTEVVVVVDSATDKTYDVASAFAAKHANVKVILCPENVGAGAARNIGLKHITGDYVYFLDADDVLFDGALDTAAKLMDTHKCDVLAFKYGYMTSESGRVSSMLSKDLKIWDTMTTRAKEVKDIELRSHAKLLLTVNYPWNKIVRRDFIERTHLSFSKTYVNNDIYAHWHIYLNAAKICVYNDTLINHRVFEKREQITNVFDERRFDAFQALHEVEVMLLADDVYSRRYYHYFLQFKLELMKWINTRMRPDLRDEFLQRVGQSYDLMHEGLFLQSFDHAPGVATESAMLRAQPQLLLRR